MLPAGSSGDSVLEEASATSGDEWIGTMLSTTSSEPLAAGTITVGDVDLVDPLAAEPEEEEIVVTGRR